jgi:hypothetical protein
MRTPARPSNIGLSEISMWIVAIANKDTCTKAAATRVLMSPILALMEMLFYPLCSESPDLSHNRRSSS